MVTFDRGYEIIIKKADETITTSFFGETNVYQLIVRCNGSDVTTRYNYRTLKVRTGVQDPANYTKVYTASNNDSLPLPMLGGYL